MADFSSTTLSGPSFLLGVVSPINYAAIIMPLTVPDNHAPRIRNVVPAAPGPLAKHDAIAFRLSDDNGAYSLREVWLRFGNATSYDLVHDGSTFLGSYAALSTITPVGNGWDFSIRRDFGWPSGAQVKLKLSVVDSGGNQVVIDA